MDDRYSSDVLAGFSMRSTVSAAPSVAVEKDLVVEVAESGFVGAVIGSDRSTVRLEDRAGRVRMFPLGPGFIIDGNRVTLVPRVAAPVKPARTASGSLAVADQRARVAMPSRIFVEGRHDAELVEKVWGDDLRVEGVVVEYLGGIDDLAQIVTDFAPTATRRIGVLVDHLVAGSKESRIADAASTSPHVLIVGHPFIDIWQAVKPARVGLSAWPDIPRGIDWKHGICAHLGWPHETQADIAMAWKRILSRVDSYADLEPVLLARVEELIDFVTVQ